MDFEQQKALGESLRLCEKLLQETEYDKERIVGCMNGELRKAYLQANELAAQEIKKIRNKLQASQQ